MHVLWKPTLTRERIMKHTPGPWKAEFDEAQKMSYVRIPKRINDVGLDTTCTLGLQKHADAVLIAKAPEIFEALKDARETIAEVIRNSDDIFAKKLCSRTLERIDPVIETVS